MTTRTTIIAAAIVAAVFVTLSACGALMMRHGRAERPAASEFGPGPRTSARGLYVATLENARALKARRMYALPVTITDASGKPVAEAAITVDGGMPQHGHGLPTRPRITRNLGGGRYELGGLRFNMGGWWELQLTITTPAGTDTVTFNLAI